jgi:serine/threonine-protein kinase
MSIVYEVEHDFTGDRLALKVLKGSAAELDPADLARFRREARVSAAVKSEHIVRVVDADVAPELGGAPFLVMDLLDGADLGEYTRGEPQPPARVVAWLRQVARALDRAHGVGIVHRDLKPENLFLERRTDGPPILKILDFGVAKVRTPDEVRHTATGSVVGTPLYMSPEQARGQPDKIGPATDIWALGMIGYRLLTGRDYWTCESVSELLAKIVYKPVAPPSVDLGAEFDAWFLRSCHRSPEQRWTSTTEQVTALAAALGVPAEGEETAGDDAPMPALVERHVPGDPTISKTVAQKTTVRDSLAQPASALAVSTVTKPRQRARIAVIGAAVAAVVGLSWTLILMTEPSAPKSASPTAAPASDTPVQDLSADEEAAEPASAQPSAAESAPALQASSATPPTASPRIKPAPRTLPTAPRPTGDPLADPH